mgnify:FL=1|jgi:hypothetical protein
MTIIPLHIKQLLNISENIDKIGFGLSLITIAGSIYTYTQDENLGIFVGLWASAIMIGSKRIHDWYN